ncbi:TniQ family protein [Cellvibrio sp. UBA7671]|uniref:TniQ family protein n=1 Tax=Cellvibrio sp. UBA7671 TaxID=1946312 RepID=UPI002F35E6A7
MGKLLFRPAPFSDECQVSYLIRISQHNGFSHIGKLLDFAGLKWKNARVPVHQILTGEFDLSSHFLQLDLKVSFAPTAEVYRSFRRVIDSPYILVKHPKLCPDCLQELGYCKYYWSFLPVVACNKHQKLLVDVQEDTGKRLSWYRPRLDSFDTNHEPILAPHQKFGSSVFQFNAYVNSLLSNTVHTVEIPKIVRGLTFRESLTLINFLAHYSARLVGDNFNPNRMENIELAQHYTAIWNLLRNWPDAFYSLLSQFIDNPMSKRGIAGINKHYRDLYEQLHRRRLNQGIAVIKEEFDRYVATYWPGVLDSQRVTRITSSIASRNIISKKKAAVVIGCRPERIDSYVIMKRLSRVIFKGKAHYLLDEADALATELGSNWTMNEACHELEITRHQLRQLLDSQILTAIQKPNRLNRDWVIDKNHCEKFIRDLSLKARIGVPKKPISRAGIQHQGFSIVQLVTAMKTGSVTFDFSPNIDHRVSFKQFSNFEINIV